MTEQDMGASGFGEDGRFFIGIGAARSGTTWLHAVLQAHPDVAVSDVKELQYFNWAYSPDVPGSALKTALVRIKRAVLPGAVQAALLNRFHHHQRLRNLLLRGQPNFNWYRGLFDGRAPGTAYGEFTPSYSTLPRSVVEEMGRLVPQARILFIMRNPVERFWSHYRYRISKDIWSLEDIQESPDDFFLSRTDYMRTINLYESVFPRAQIHYAFYEDLSEDPRAFITDLCRFLGVPDLPEAQAHLLHTRVNASTDIKMPDSLRLQLEQAAGDTVARVEAHVGRVPPSWRQSA